MTTLGAVIILVLICLTSGAAGGAMALWVSKW